MLDCGVPHHLATIITMSSPSIEYTQAQWDALFDQFHASGLSQVAFCKERSLLRHTFAYRYRRSEKFAGTRKGSPRSNQENGQTGSGFRTVHRKPVSVVEPLADESVVIHIGQDVRLQCPAAVGVEAIVRLAREARS
jgi:hypothetical protein